MRMTKRFSALVLVLAAACSGGGYEHEGTYESRYGFSDHITRGVVQVERGNYDEAIRLFTVAINVSPSNPEGYYHRGNVWVLKHDANKALFDYSEAIRVDAHHKHAYFKRGWVQYNMVGDLDAALEDFNEAIQEDVTYSDAYLWRGQTYRAMKVFNSAVADFEAAMRHGGASWNFKKQCEQWLWETRQQAAASR
jgi:tetratricopeptide (TPR) repeat protein